MTGPDEQMDHRSGSYEPSNPLPIKCAHCTFPDLDFVPQPYSLTKGVSSPAETSNAHFGNFFVRDRVKRILEIAVPEACAFYRTNERKGNKPTPWWLAVPQITLKTAMPKPKSPFCSKCHEPKVWGPLMGPVWDKMCQCDSGGVDVFKSCEWFTRKTVEDDYKATNRYRKQDGMAPLPWSFWRVEAPLHAQRWTRRGLTRDLYFSVRLEQLFKSAKVRGRLVRLSCFDKVRASAEDELWIAGKLNLLYKAGLVEVAPTSSSGASRSWFKMFLKQNVKKGLNAPDFKTVEQKHKLTLPQTYKEFISAVGSKAFRNLRDMDGYVATILSPQRLNFRDYRRGRVPFLEGEEAQVDGVMFADTNGGDCFVFDVAANAKDYPVYWYRHEENTMEQFASNFSECIRRFAQRD
jgi:hypothetical protein